MGNSGADDPNNASESARLHLDELTELVSVLQAELVAQSREVADLRKQVQQESTAGPGRASFPKVWTGPSGDTILFWSLLWCLFLCL